MADLAKKLQLRSAGVRVLNAPEGFSAGAHEAEQDDDDAAVLVFVRKRADLEKHAAPVLEAARRDRLAWIAYPKAGQLETDLNRDVLWEALSGTGVRPVRQIAIDNIWSAMRFRPES